MQSPKIGGCFSIIIIGVLVMMVLFSLIRGFCGFLFVWQILGLMPALSWLQQPSAIAGSMWVVLIIKLLAAIIFGFIFFGFRRLINFNYIKKINTPDFGPKPDTLSESTSFLAQAKESLLHKLLRLETFKRGVLSLSISFTILILIVATMTINLSKDWSNAHQQYVSKTQNSNLSSCNKLKLENCDAYLNINTNNTNLLVEGMLKFDGCEKRNSGILAQSECLIGNPGTQVSYILNKLNQSNFLIPMSILSGVLVFVSLLTGRCLILEPNLGWKRLSIVLAVFVAISLAIYLSIVVLDSPANQEEIFWIFVGLMLIPQISIISVLKGRLLFKWVKVGFNQS